MHTQREKRFHSRGFSISFVAVCRWSLSFILRLLTPSESMGQFDYDSLPTQHDHCCNYCSEEFGLLFDSGHTCGRCRQQFCADCASKSVTVVNPSTSVKTSLRGSGAQMRVCDDCFRGIRTTVRKPAPCAAAAQLGVEPVPCATAYTDGTLHVQIVRAVGLQEPAWTVGKMRPYIVGFLSSLSGSQSTKTAGVHGTSPAWPQAGMQDSGGGDISFAMGADVDSRRLHLQVWDQNHIGPDSFVGCVDVDIDAIRRGGMRRGVECKIDTGGTLVFNVWFTATEALSALQSSQRSREGLGGCERRPDSPLRNRPRSGSADSPAVPSPVSSPTKARSRSWSERPSRVGKMQVCIRLVSASGLRPNNHILGCMDPYVVAHLLPEPGACDSSQPPPKCRSGTARDGGADPSWKSSGTVAFRGSVYGSDKVDCLRLPVEPASRRKNRTVLLEIWNKCLLGDKFVGSALVQLPPFSAHLHTFPVGDLWHAVNTGGWLQCSVEYVHG